MLDLGYLLENSQLCQSAWWVQKHGPGLLQRGARWPWIWWLGLEGRSLPHTVCVGLLSKSFRPITEQDQVHWTTH